VPWRTRAEHVLAAWRRIDLADLEADRTTRARAAGDVMPRVLQDMRLDGRAVETALAQAWNRLLDPNVTAHAQPTGVRNGTLFVTVDSSPWLDEIVRYRRFEILERLQAAFGATVVRRISFRVG
jgi:predicted nucleic acid-binding Zn ribbon protein